jgi:predicted Zn-dependent peptidase
MIGQPIKGDRDYVSTISVDMLKDYQAANYYGENIVVVATGDVSHEQIVD